MSYHCDVCTSVTPANQPLLKITLFKEHTETCMIKKVVQDAYTLRDRIINVPEGTRIVRQIEKELKACQLCFEGHGIGIPLANLAKMHRPVPKETTPLYESTSTIAPKIEHYFGPTIAGVPVTLPKEDRTAKFLAAEENSRKPKGRGKRDATPLKPLIKRGHANRQAKQAQAKN